MVLESKYLDKKWLGLTQKQYSFAVQRTKELGFKKIQDYLRYLIAKDMENSNSE